MKYIIFNYNEFSGILLILLRCQHKITFLIPIVALSKDYAYHPAPRTPLAKRKCISTRQAA